MHSDNNLRFSFHHTSGSFPEVARADACKMEHDVSDESFEKIKEHLTAKGEI